MSTALAFSDAARKATRIGAISNAWVQGRSAGRARWKRDPGNRVGLARKFWNLGYSRGRRGRANYEQMEFELEPLTLNAVGGPTEFSRQLVIQASVDLETWRNS